MACKSELSRHYNSFTVELDIDCVKSYKSIPLTGLVLGTSVKIICMPTISHIPLHHTLLRKSMSVAPTSDVLSYYPSVSSSLHTPEPKDEKAVSLSWLSSSHASRTILLRQSSRLACSILTILGLYYGEGLCGLWS